MKFVKRLILLVFLLLTGNVVLGQEAVNLTAECVESFDPSVDYFPEKATLEYTNGFEVEYFNNYKVVTVTAPWRDAAPDDAVRYVLVQCGTPAPEGFDSAQVIEVPVQTFVSMSTTYLPYVEIYGLADQLVGVDVLAAVSTPAVLAIADRLTEVSPNYELNLEVALELDPQMIMFYGFGFDTDSYLQLQANGLTVVLNGEFAEDTPLGRAEWGKFLALFFNKEGIAQEALEAVAVEYNALADLAAGVEERPTVFVNSPFDGTWYMPGGQSFFARFLADAGADYLWAGDESAGTLFLDFEAVYDIAAEADFWVNANQFWFTAADALAEDERYADFAAFENGSVWINNLAINENFGNDFYESGVAYPNLILADLVALFHPELLPDHEFVYYQQLGE